MYNNDPESRPGTSSNNRVKLFDKADTNFQKLAFRITEVSSEEEGYPVTELLNHTPFSRGWQSSRFCDYPQEILIEFPFTVRVRQIQFLSHQYKISSKIEILILSSEKEKNKFKKIGYLGLDSNERSNFQARELKSVYIDYKIQKLKICLQRCHTNIHNTFSQIGLIAINVLGEYSVNNEQDNNIMKKLNSNNEQIGAKLEEEMNYDPATLKRLKNLYKAKEKAVELEDFDEAKQIKQAINRLKSVSQQLIQLEERKRIAIKNDDFDSAKMLKYEIERLRNAVTGMKLANPEEDGKPFPMQLNKNKNEFAYQEDVEYQNESDQIPLGKERLKLLPPVNNNSNRNEMPLTSDMLLEDEAKMNRIKNINPNEGYKLADQKLIKAKIDVDDQIIKGISKDFSEIVNEKMKSDPKKNNDNRPEEIEDDIPASEFKTAEPLVPILSYDIVKLLFSKYWRNKEEGVNRIIEEIENYPKGGILGQHTADKILTAVSGAAASVLSCTITQPLMASMDMLKSLLNKFRGSQIGGYLRTDFDTYIDTCMLLLIEKVGDNNLKLKERAENTIMEFANHSLIGHKTIFEDLIKGKIKKTLEKSAKHLSARLNLISRMINNFGLNSNDVPIDQLMTYAVNAYKDPNKDVREASYNLIMNVYKFLGDNIRSYFKDLRPAQINTLEEGFENLDGMNNPNENQEGGNREFLNDSQMVYENNSDYNNYQKQAKVKSNINNKKNKIETTDEQEQVYDNSNDNQQYSNNNNHIQNDMMKNEGTSCGFCGYFDLNFDEDALYIHCFKECPMLTSCYKCKQTVEISALNYHYTNECKFKKDFRLCPRCKEPIDLDDYTQHISEKACYPAKNPNIANRCPLCHTDVTPSGKIGWEVHLLQNSCPNNPRTNY